MCPCGDVAHSQNLKPQPQGRHGFKIGRLAYTSAEIEAQGRRCHIWRPISGSRQWQTAVQSDESERRRSLRPLRNLFPYVLRYRGMVAAAVFFLLLAAATTLTLPLAVRRMIDHGFSTSDSTFIANYFSMLVIIAALLALASAGRYYFVITLGERVVSDLRREVFEHVTQLSPAFFDRAQSGEIVSRLTADATQIKSAVGATASVALRNVILGLGALAMMVVTSPKLSGPRDCRHPIDRAAAGGVRPFRPPQVADGPGHASRRRRLCERADRIGAHAAGLHE